MTERDGNSVIGGKGFGTQAKSGSLPPPPSSAPPPVVAQVNLQALDQALGKLMAAVVATHTQAQQNGQMIGVLSTAVNALGRGSIGVGAINGEQGSNGQIVGNPRDAASTSSTPATPITPPPPPPPVASRSREQRYSPY